MGSVSDVAGFSGHSALVVVPGAASLFFFSPQGAPPVGRRLVMCVSHVFSRAGAVPRKAAPLAVAFV